MNADNDSEQIERTERYVTSEIYNNEANFYYSFAFGALAIFFYLVSRKLEHGNLLGITNILGLISLYLWWNHNPWFVCKKLEPHIKEITSTEILERHKLYVLKSKKVGAVSFIIMLVAMYYVGWVYQH